MFRFASLPLVGLVFVLPSGAGGCHAEPDDAVSGAGRPAARKAAPAPPPCDSKDDPLLTAPFTDDFARTELGPDWRSTSYGAYFIKQGRLCIAKPRNHPVWLKRKLPTNVRIEVTATPLSNNADVKLEIFGDGCGFDTTGREYTSTAYVAVLGAHGNSEHWLARLYEHGNDLRRTVVAAGAPTIAKGKLVAHTPYRVELVRTDGKELRFVVDGAVVHTFEDPKPLAGPGHDHFAFDGWDAPTCFDNLTVTPLP